MTGLDYLEITIVIGFALYAIINRICDTVDYQTKMYTAPRDE